MGTGATRFVTHPFLGRTPERRAALFDRIGPGVHRCHWCGARVAWKLRGVQTKGTGRLMIDSEGQRVVPVCVGCKNLRSLTEQSGK
jgi:hypothetical protein